MALLRLGTANRTPLTRIVLGVTLAVWLFACANELQSVVVAPGKFTVALLLALLAAPILLLNASRVPAYFLAAYGATVPFSDILVSGAGPTYTNILGIITGVSLISYIIVPGRCSTPSKSVVLGLVLAAYMGATIFWAIDPALALKNFEHYLSLIALFVVISLYPFTARDLKIVLAGVIVGGAVLAGYADAVLFQAQTSRAVIATNDALIDPNSLATSLLLPIALTLTLFLGARLGPAKFAWLGTLLVLLTGFASSGSRGATLGLAFMGAFLLLRSKYRVQLLAVASAAVLLVVMSPIGSRFLQSDVGNADGRFVVWRVALTSLRQYWLVGAGVGNFNQAFMQYFLRVPHDPISWDRVAHSVVVGAAVELGIPGLLLLLALWYASFHELAKIERNGDDTWTDVCFGLRAGVLGVFVAGLSLSLMPLKYPWLTFALIAATRSALTRYERK